MPIWAIALVGVVLLMRNNTTTVVSQPPAQQPATQPAQQRDAGAQAADVIGALGTGIAGILNAYGQSTNQSYQTGSV